MARDNAKKVLLDRFATNADIENAIAHLEADIAYVERSQVTNPAGDLGSSLRESRALLYELQVKLNNQSR